MIPRQGGDAHFIQRFAFKAVTGSGGWSDEIRMEHQNPLVTEASSQRRRPAREILSLLKNISRRAAVGAQAGGRRQHQRHHRASGISQGAATLDFIGGVPAAKQVSHIETDLADARVVAARHISDRSIATLDVQAHPETPLGEFHGASFIRNSHNFQFLLARRQLSTGHAAQARIEQRLGGGVKPSLPSSIQVGFVNPTMR
jgi:hypothetical protein